MLVRLARSFQPLAESEVVHSFLGVSLEGEAPPEQVLEVVVSEALPGTIRRLKASHPLYRRLLGIAHRAAYQHGMQVKAAIEPRTKEQKTREGRSSSLKFS